MSKRPRKDALEGDYRDTGCSVAPSCLNCPLPRCRYDVQGGVRTLINVDRDPAIRRAVEQGTSAVEVARQFGLSRRMVSRIIHPKFSRQ